MTIRSSDVIPPSRYWLAVIAVMGFPLLSCFVVFFLEAELPRARESCPESEIRSAQKRVCAPQVVGRKSVVGVLES
jgi:hypothetical protein